MGDNVVVNGMWVGAHLSLMELLTLKCFVDHGHRFLLWTYGQIPQDELPEGVELRDASSIIPAREVFSYRRGPHAGSYAGFSDIFRYNLLHDRGGWWVDMDVACLKSFDFPEPYVFRPRPTCRRPAGPAHYVKLQPSRYRLRMNGSASGQLAARRFSESQSSLCFTRQETMPAMRFSVILPP